MSACRAARVRKLEATKAKRATKRELVVAATMISRMIGTSLFSDRTEFSVATGVDEPRAGRIELCHEHITNSRRAAFLHPLYRVDDIRVESLPPPETLLSALGAFTERLAAVDGVRDG